ncbi:hypothetical protein [Ramlibacter montanisoli]|uniref:Uncharacterized protein n=1 Tax=Ramlibacter montanisoli TaxID=2732512 RepID=A0A849KCG8_9BURK|nr:hypothetical protein [Ramlibacter montanisoli]NNU41953.1 hypothetical protein [Ramlibacter montanisoli]
MKRLMLTAVALAVSGAALAKLPPPVLDEAAKAKAAEAAAKTAWQGKLDAFQLCKAQDRAVSAYKRVAATRPAASATAGAPAAAAATATTTAAAPAAAAAKPVPTPASASQGGSTPVAAAAPPLTPCADPGPFAYAPPEQKPLEASGAHSPAANATSPPSVRPNAAEMTPSKPSVATKK